VLKFVTGLSELHVLRVERTTEEFVVVEDW